MGFREGSFQATEAQYIAAEGGEQQPPFSIPWNSSVLHAGYTRVLDYPSLEQALAEALAAPSANHIIMRGQGFTKRGL